MPTLLPLDQLHAHDANSNVMPTKLLAKLAGHIERSGRYPPVIVRPHDGAYQILDGHHRVKAIQTLGYTQVQCEVWDVDDREALVLLTTLNRLEGRDDPKKRGALVDALMEGMALPALAKLLPEETGKLRALASLHAAPPPRPVRPEALKDTPVAVTFFVTAEQRKALEHRLREVGGSRERALLELTGVLDASDA
ncbi:MAG: ParB/RepB/Spo0J family partition protein [Phycisphaerales bacterium JB063]